jgi:CRP/FNR family transcriptional regulator
LIRIKTAVVSIVLEVDPPTDNGYRRFQHLAAPVPIMTKGSDPGSTIAGASPLSGTPLLGEHERQTLLSIATPVEFRKGAIVYRAGDTAEAIFILASGVVKSYRAVHGGKEAIAGFRFINDIIGLSEDDKYSNTVRTITRVTLFKISTGDFEKLLIENPNMSYIFMRYFMSNLAEASKQINLLHHLNPLNRVCFLLEILQKKQSRANLGTEIYLPMSRRDISFYLGISAEVLSRTIKYLIDQKIISFRNRQHATILDRTRFNSILAEIRPD